VGRSSKSTRGREV
jgi:Homeodomain-like domain